MNKYKVTYFNSYMRLKSKTIETNDVCSAACELLDVVDDSIVKTCECVVKVELIIDEGHNNG